MHSSYFVLKNKEGKQAEQIVKDYLTGRGYTVQDVSEEQDNYQNDIDFIVQKDGRTSKIEVKLDTRLAETQNIAFEDVFYLKDKETGQTETREGYYHYSQCDFLIFVSPADRNLYMVHLVSNKENLDTSTPTGKLMLTMIAAINEFERENLLERQREGIAIAKAEGKFKGGQVKRIDDKTFCAAYDRYQHRELNKTQLAAELRISRPTLNKLLKDKGLS